MASLNKIMIIGNLGSEPEMRFTPNGNPVTSFSVATNRFYNTPDGERKQETEWFTVVAWNKLAELCNQFLTKGRLVYAEGRLHTSTWESQDGQKHARPEVVASQVVFLDRDRQSTALPHESKVEDAGSEGLEPEDIPFSNDNQDSQKEG
jgi:single-strand DNA-binding protein